MVTVVLVVGAAWAAKSLPGLESRDIDYTGYLLQPTQHPAANRPPSIILHSTRRPCHYPGWLPAKFAYDLFQLEQIAQTNTF